jgi:hypothetical protein
MAWAEDADGLPDMGSLSIGRARRRSSGGRRSSGQYGLLEDEE